MDSLSMSDSDVSSRASRRPVHTPLTRSSSLSASLILVEAADSDLSSWQTESRRLSFSETVWSRISVT